MTCSTFENDRRSMVEQVEWLASLILLHHHLPSRREVVVEQWSRAVLKIVAEVEQNEWSSSQHRLSAKPTSLRPSFRLAGRMLPATALVGLRFDWASWSAIGSQAREFGFIVRLIPAPKKGKPIAMGRHSTYTDEIAQKICDRLSTGEPLAQICRDEGMPHTTTVYDWRTADTNGFALRFARAREDGFDQIAMDALHIADESGRDTITTKDGDRPDSEWIARSRLRVDTRLKLLAKWDFKRYGERVTHAGDQDNPVEVRSIVRRVVDPAA